jgi:hypothetical protein
VLVGRDRVERERERERELPIRIDYSLRVPLTDCLQDLKGVLTLFESTHLVETDPCLVGEILQKRRGRGIQRLAMLDLVLMEPVVILSDTARKTDVLDFTHVNAMLW